MSSALLYGLAGWCGSVPLSVLIRILLRRVPPPPPPPDPWVPWLVSRVLGVAGGIGAGLAFGSSDPMPSLVGVAAAFFGGMALTDIGQRFARQE